MTPIKNIVNQTIYKIIKYGGYIMIIKEQRDLKF